MNKELQVIEEQITKCQEAKTKIVVNSQESYDQALAFGKKANQLLKYIDNKEKEITKPLNDVIKKTRDQYRQPKEQVNTIIKEVKDVMVEYINAENAKKKLEAERIEKRLEKGTMREDTAINKLAVAEETKTVTNGGMTTVLVIKIVDKSKIPMDYLIVDENKIRKDYHAGITIPGVTYENEKRARL